jgi:hypothetical protein
MVIKLNIYWISFSKVADILNFLSEALEQKGLL